MENLVVDLAKVSATLQNQDALFEYDDAWDTYQLFNESHTQYIPDLIKMLEVDHESVRHYALVCLNRIKGDLSPYLDSIFSCLRVERKFTLIGNLDASNVNQEIIKIVERSKNQSPARAVYFLDKISKCSEIGFINRLKAGAMAKGINKSYMNT